MSGPKTSRYVLTAEQRRRIEEQQRIIRETKIAQDRRNSTLRKAKINLDNLNSVIFEFEQLCKESGRGKAELQNMKKLFKDLHIAVNNKVYQAEGLVLEVYRKQINSLDGCISKVRTEIAKTKQMYVQIRSEYKSELENTIETGFILDFAGLGENRKYEGNPIIKRINDALEKLIYEELPDNLKERLVILQKRATEITSIDFLENFYSTQVRPFADECGLYQEHGKEYEELFMKYSMLAEEVVEKIKNYEFSMQAIEELKQDIVVLENKILLEKEQEYISAAIDEAMQEMGYELVGNRNVVKKSGRKFKNELYQFGEGTAVNVTFSDNGQISMELGALDVTNRVPTDKEAVELADDMRAFCNDYSELEKKLAQKGIVSKRISVLPPALDYAQVFDISDYEMRKSIELYKQEKTRKHEVKRQRQIHKEG